MRNHRVVLVIISFIEFLTLLLTIPHAIYAQQVSLSLDPPVNHAIIKPGKNIVLAYNLRNYEDPIIVTTNILPFVPYGSYGQIKILNSMEGPIRFNLDNADIKLQESFFLQGKKTQQLLLKIRVPEGTPEGDYYYIFMAGSEPNIGVLGSTAAGAKPAIGSNLLITVTSEGNIDSKGEISEFSVDSPYHITLFGKRIQFFESTDSVPVRLIIRNNGRNMIQPHGTVTMKGNFGEKSTFEVLAQNILANSERLIEATPSAEFDCDDKSSGYICKRPSSLLIPGFYVGKYQLSASVTFGESTNTIFAGTTFYAFPIKFTIGILFSIIIIIVIIKRFRPKE